MTNPEKEEIARANDLQDHKCIRCRRKQRDEPKCDRTV